MTTQKTTLTIIDEYDVISSFVLRSTKMSEHVESLVFEISGYICDRAEAQMAARSATNRTESAWYAAKIDEYTILIRSFCDWMKSDPGVNRFDMLIEAHSVALAMAAESIQSLIKESMTDAYAWKATTEAEEWSKAVAA